MLRPVSRPLHAVFPPLRRAVPFAPLAELPTPVQSLRPLLAALGRRECEVYDKRDDLSSPVYGGNKVRTLEVLFGRALARGATHVYATGAYGSNHAVATVLHAGRVGLATGVTLYPQPASHAALENLESILSRRPHVRDLPHWSALPVGMWLTSRDAAARGEVADVMVPGGAIPYGALGYVSAALELAFQVQAGELPAPRTIVAPVGSNCTVAGLLAGTALAARRGLGWVESGPPAVVAVRVTPWPVTSRVRIVGLAVGVSRLVAELTGDASLALDRREVSARLTLDGDHLGRGYGYATPEGRAAVRSFAAYAGHALDTTYSGKAGAALLDLLQARPPEPVLFWSTKSSAPLPPMDSAAIADAPAGMRRWMRAARATQDRSAPPSC